MHIQGDGTRATDECCTPTAFKLPNLCTSQQHSQKSPDSSRQLPIASHSINTPIIIQAGAPTCTQSGATTTTTTNTLSTYHTLQQKNTATSPANNSLTAATQNTREPPQQQQPLQLRTPQRIPAYLQPLQCQSSSSNPCRNRHYYTRQNPNQSLDKSNILHSDQDLSVMTAISSCHVCIIFLHRSF